MNKGTLIFLLAFLIMQASCRLGSSLPSLNDEEYLNPDCAFVENGAYDAETDLDSGHGASDDIKIYFYGDCKVSFKGYYKVHTTYVIKDHILNIPKVWAREDESDEFKDIINRWNKSTRIVKSGSTLTLFDSQGNRQLTLIQDVRFI